MAPTRPATRKQPEREADYSNVGVAGRKTGIVLKDSGVRDQDGMEPIEGIFSSPDRPSSTRKRKSGNSTLTHESDMDIGHSSIPDPKEMLRASLPPPRSRSPMKTNLGSPARRSVGPRSSPSKAPVTRSSADRSSPLAQDSPTQIRRAAATVRPTKNQTFDMPVSEDEEPQDQSMEELPVVDEMPDLNGDDSLQVTAEDSIELARNEVEASPPLKRKRGRPRKDDEASAKNSKAPAKTASRVPAEAGAKRGRGRPRKDGVTANHAAKRAPKPVARPSTPEAGPSRAKSKSVTTPDRNAMKPPPTHRGTNATVRGVADSEVTWAGTERTKPRARGLRILRSETPAEDLGATVMKSGRTSVKPMAYWRNERLVFGEGRLDHGHLELPGIKEVIRTEEITPDPKPRKRRRINRRRGPQTIESDEDMEEWEAELGILEASVPQWDPLQQKASEEIEEEIEIAYAPKGLDLATREVKGATFLYGKTLSLPFFHSGIVDLPPGGEKRPKQSRGNHIVFWVFAGRVDVNVSDNQFSIGRGGMFQVPRGNLYGIRNSYERPARLMFAQGCYMQDEEGMAPE